VLLLLVASKFKARVVQVFDIQCDPQETSTRLIADIL
jgi:hypothetical protein